MKPRPGEIVAVVAGLDVSPGRLAAMRATFTAREAARFVSFAHEEHRNRWGAARGALREVLGAALGQAPADVEIRYGPHGKPYVDGLRFNLSHSGARALIALSVDCEVGADIELPRERRRTDDIARRFFTAGEIARLFASVDRKAEFFRLWCCKEAFLKATGEGLSRSTRSYEIEFTASGARLLWANGIPDAATRYSVFPLDPGDGYRAAVVAEGGGLKTRLVRWP
ncbi:MAG: 4'-phosphopantetheinyl transferase superfamily protein [Myxococcales bacterium]|nr:4'-phosphopantetheinyl transferase superfamily protein [Myxococcales bacterium]